MGKHKRDPAPAYIRPILKLKELCLPVNGTEQQFVVGCQYNIQLHEPQASAGVYVQILLLLLQYCNSRNSQLFWVFILNVADSELLPPMHSMDFTAFDDTKKCKRLGKTRRERRRLGHLRPEPGGFREFSSAMAAAADHHRVGLETGASRFDHYLTAVRQLFDQPLDHYFTIIRPAGLEPGTTESVGCAC
jgi:hypothetical protein